ncbi:MAG: galactose-1-phosphate uridylyltransferase [Deltaproteobacteria bacterium]|nr:galactose-1-phosphate uridylyltransferase [Deltaproteobacteria bacterium]
MPELRQNIITRHWVIIATERARRPHEFSRKEERTPLPQHVPTCPFCPGNEEKTPQETLRLPNEGTWRVRVFPNRFPALAATGEIVRTQSGIKRAISAVGIHEVVVETPDHNQTLSTMGDREVEQVVEAYLQRHRAALSASIIEHVTIFKNHGAAAGTSLEHPHSQLIATPIIPSEVRERLESALQFYDDNGQCIFCFTLEQEALEGVRVVEQNPHFLAFIPYAALSPYHLWIFPKRHCASFGCIDDEEKIALAQILRRLLVKLDRGLNHPDYNFVIRTAPKESETVRYYHWYIAVVPRLSQTAGFELGSGMFINSALPEESARFLGEVKAD